MARRQIDFHEVMITFVVRKREAKRCANSKRALAYMLGDAIIGNATNALDAEDVAVTIDGKIIRP